MITDEEVEQLARALHALTTPFGSGHAAAKVIRGMIENAVRSHLEDDPHLYPGVIRGMIENAVRSHLEDGPHLYPDGSR